jgi:CRP-like cAMP-binding protein
VPTISRPSPADRAWWAAVLRTVAPLDDVELGRLSPHLEALTFDPGEAYLRTGTPAHRVGLVKSGVLREYFTLADGTERTRGFAIEGDFSGSLSDLLLGGPARTSVTAEAKTRVLSVPWAVVADLVAHREAWRTVLHRITERLYLAKAEREYELLGLDAEERYRRFVTRFPRLLPVVAQKHVASYLGITAEHLSRIRGRRATKRNDSQEDGKTARRR